MHFDYHRCDTTEFKVYMVPQNAAKDLGNAPV